MKRILLVLENKDFEELDKAKSKMSKQFGSIVKWESFVLNIFRRKVNK